MAFEAFTRYIRRVAQGVGDRSNLLVRRVATTALEELVRGTPVDTGQARSNWRVGVGRPVRGTRPPFFPGQNLGRGETANAGAAIAEGRAVISTVRSGSPTVFITNDVPYLSLLRNGSSRQQPNDWVATSLTRARRLISEARLVVR